MFRFGRLKEKENEEERRSKMEIVDYIKEIVIVDEKKTF